METVQKQINPAIINHNGKQYLKWHGFFFAYYPEFGYTPLFQRIIQTRVNRKLATNVVFCGEAGIGKSYLAIDCARVLEGIKPNGEERFSIDQVVFDYKSFMELILKLEPGKVIVFDEPSYSMGKREWYKDLNKVLVQTIESFRFKIHPLFIPIINIQLLDKTIRDYLVQYQVVVKARGKADVYRLSAGHFEDKIWHEYICRLQYAMLTRCKEESCLSCDKLETCTEFRAQYERKKASIQDYRYEQARDLTATREATQLTMTQIENFALTLSDQFIKDNGRIDVEAMRLALKDKYGIQLSHNRAYSLKRALEIHHKELLSMVQQ